MRLIDADALYKNLGFAEECKDCDHQYNSVFCESSTWQVVCDAIYEAPTIDAVPVVRCNDCKHFKSKTENTGICDGGFCHAPVHVAVIDFCPYGERKDHE